MATKHLTNMKAYIISLFLFIPVIIFGQNTHEINLTITDTVITVKKSTKRNKYAAKVNVKINVPDLEDTLSLYFFNKYIPAGSFSGEEPFDEFYKSTYIGLNYIVEDKNHNVIRVRTISGGSIYQEKRIFVTSKQRIKLKKLNKEQQHNYDLAKYEIINEQQCLESYPLLSGVTTNVLSKGEYYLYFVYVFKSEFPYVGLFEAEEVAKNSRIFKGSFVSNKVKLIVK